MYTDELLDVMADAIAADTALSSWCNSNFGKDPEIFVGINQEQPPTDEHYPAVAITEIRQIKTPGSAEVSWQIKLSAMVRNEEVSKTGSISKYVGFQQAERMRELVESALQLFPGPVAFRRHGESISIVTYPLFESQSTVIVKMLRRGNV